VAELPLNSLAPFDASNPPRSVNFRRKPRHVALFGNAPLIGRTTFAAHLQQAALKVSPTSSYPNLIAFVHVSAWVREYLRDAKNKISEYRTYPPGKDGIFRIQSPEDGALTIAIAADWGTGTMESARVANNIDECHPHYTVHLGDVYYMGEEHEVSENCLGVNSNGYTGVYWARGTRGSFALMGNHEMYSGGTAYYEKFLEKLGIGPPNTTPSEPQSASYFCLETEHWIILGLDTGYHSGGFPLVTSVPLINRISALNVNAQFDEEMMMWLEQTIQTLKQAGELKKPVLVLTHHQPISSFEHAFAKPAKQLADTGFLNGREFVWLYGHEHRMTIYNKQRIAKTLTAYPRCIGHGGMPVSVTTVNSPDPKILYYDPRKHPIDNENQCTFVGYNGHVVLTFDGQAMKVEYCDITDGKLLYSETFTPGLNNTLVRSDYKPADSPYISGL